MRAIAANGTDPTIELIKGLTKMDRRTIKNHWDPAIELLATGAILAAIIAPKNTPTFCSDVRG